MDYTLLMQSKKLIHIDAILKNAFYNNKMVNGAAILSRGTAANINTKLFLKERLQLLDQVNVAHTTLVGRLHTPILPYFETVISKNCKMIWNDPDQYAKDHYVISLRTRIDQRVYIWNRECDWPEYDDVRRGVHIIVPVSDVFKWLGISEERQVLEKLQGKNLYEKAKLVEYQVKIK